MGVMQPAAAAYARMLRALLPPGRLWSTSSAGLLEAVLLAFGDELVRVSGRAADLVEESDPRTCDELLEDYERVLALDATGTDAERRARVAARLVSRQRFRPADYQLALAGLLGQAVADVDVRENDRAFAIAVGDDSEIFKFYVYRDPTDPGSYDLAAAQSLIDEISPAHTSGFAIESISLLCDTATDLCDRDLLGV